MGLLDHARGCLQKIVKCLIIQMLVVLILKEVTSLQVCNVNWRPL